MNTRAGTPNYISPEVLAGNYSIDCDCWSAGCILYILLCGYPPFFGDDDQEILQMVAKGKFDFDGEEWLDVSKEAKDLIKKLICKPERRLTAQEALDHKWFKKALKHEQTKPITFGKERFQRFKSYNQTNKMQQAAMMSMSVQVSPAEVKELSHLFKQLDIDGSGTLTIDELIKGLDGFENKEKLIEILEGADTDGSGDINYSEFLAATMDDNIYLREDYLKTAFDLFDKDRSGKIDSQEVIALLSGDDMTTFISKEAINQAINEIDANGDGEIDFQEFMLMMKRAAQQDEIK